MRPMFNNMPMQRAEAGHFYAVGVGPGSPDLLTLRAVYLIRSCEVILTPRASGSGRSLALKTIRPFLDKQEILLSTYPMERNDRQTREHWRQLAETVAERCAGGASVVQITLGDPLIFATSSYLLQGLSGMMSAERLHVVPGISAFQTSASRFRQSLTLQEDRLMLMSATDPAAVAQALDQCETLVLYKVGAVITPLMALLERRGLLSHSSLVSCGEQGSHELLVEDLSCWSPTPLGYMTTMIIRLGSRAWREGA